MVKHYKVNIAGNRGNLDPYFSTESFAIEQTLVYIISTLEKNKEKVLKSESLELYFRKATYYFYAGSSTENEYVTLSFPSLSFAHQIVEFEPSLLNKQFLECSRLIEARDDLLDEEENDGIEKDIKSLNEKTLSFFQDQVSTIVDLLNLSINHFNNELKLFSQNSGYSSKMLEKSQDKSFNIDGFRTYIYKIAWIEEANVMIDEIIPLLND